MLCLTRDSRITFISVVCVAVFVGLLAPPQFLRATALPPVAATHTLSASAIISPATASNGCFDPPYGSFGGTVTAIAVDGALAYLGEGYGLTILDISNPAQPTVRARIPLLQPISGLQVTNGLAYIADSTGLHIIDIRNPDCPIPRGSYTAEGAVTNVQVIGNLAYVTSNALLVIDVSNPDVLTPRGRFDTWNYISSMEVQGNLAYLTNGSFLIVDVSNPDLLLQKGYSSEITGAWHVHVSGSLAYLNRSSESLLLIVDVSNPSLPTLMSSINAAGMIQDVQTIGSYAYVIYNKDAHIGGLQTLDMHIATTPTSISNLALRGIPNKITISDHRAYITLGESWSGDASLINGLTLVDLLDTANPRIDGTYAIPGYIEDLRIADSYAYVIDPLSGFAILNIQNPLHPSQESYIALPGSAKEIAVLNHFAYITYNQITNASVQTLQIVDITDPLSPTLRGGFTPAGAIGGMDAGGEYVYLGGQSLSIIDVSNPDMPTLRGTYTPTIPASITMDSIKFESNRAYIGISAAGATNYLEIIDVGDPTAPHFIGRYAIPKDIILSTVSSVNVSGTLAFVTDDYCCYHLSPAGGNLYIIDLSNPSSPLLRGRYVTRNEMARNVQVIGDRAYLIAGNHIYILDVSNPNIPKRSAIYPWPAENVQIGDRLLYLAETSGGLRIGPIWDQNFYLPFINRRTS